MLSSFSYKFVAFIFFSGKTHTMLGTPSNPGIIPRVINGIFEQIEAERKSNTEDWKYTVKFSYLEIYNEKVCMMECCKFHINILNFIHK